MGTPPIECNEIGAFAAPISLYSIGGVPFSVVNAMPGLFISLDGLDGTGKSTQIQLLADWLQSIGRRVVTCVDPGGTPIGDALRHIVLDHRRDITLPCEALLFMASRAELVHRIIEPALRSEAVVISDRYLLATVVYQGYGGGLDVDELWRVGRFAANGVEPALTLVLDLPPDVAETRRGTKPDRLESRERSYHERVREGFLAEARRRPEAIRIVDANGSVEQVHTRVRAAVESFLNRG